jgi:hypothetical protein
MPAIWPSDRFELRCSYPPPQFSSTDRYHYPELVYEAVQRLRETGFALEIQVVRLIDGAVVFDLMAGVDLPLNSW